VSFDVFEETKFRSHDSNSICDVRPEVTGIVGAKSLAGCAKGLAGVASRKDIHAV
jgi:hypothetical protein